MDGKTCRILSMTILCFIYFFMEIGIGYYTGSIALIADSFHMLSDVVALVIAFIAIKMSAKKTDKNTFGWARAEVLGALVNAIFLLGLCFNILMEAIQRLFTIEEVTDPILVAIVGSVGLFINLIGLAMFNGQGHGHSHGGSAGHGHSHGGAKPHHSGRSGHGHSHDGPKKPHHSEKSHILDDGQSLTTDSQITSGDQMNMKGVFLHILGDALASIVVIGSALAIHFIDGAWTVYIDPGISIVVVGIIVCTCYPLLKESSMILLQSLPVNIDFNELTRRIENEFPAGNLHEFHVWQLSGEVVIATVHLSFEGDVGEYMRKADGLRKLFHQNGIHSATIQPEFVHSSNNSVAVADKSCAVGCKDIDCGDKKCCSSPDHQNGDDIIQSHVCCKTVRACMERRICNKSDEWNDLCCQGNSTS